MRKFSLLSFVILLNLLMVGHVFSQSGKVKEKVIISSPSGLKPKPADLPPPTRNSSPPLGSMMEGREVPDYVIYEMVFRLAQAGWSPEERKFNPQERLICKRYRQEKILNPKQEEVLRSIAEDTELAIEKLNQQVKPLVEEFRAKMRSGAPGEGRPTPPPEVEELSKKRITVIDEAIEKLKTSLGEKDFARFNDFVDKTIRAGTRTGTIPVP